METIKYVGVDDWDIERFEGQYFVSEGMAYNSYVVIGEKTAVLDSVDGKKSGEWLQNLDAALGGKAPDYLVVQHVEPDHSGSVKAFAEKYPETKVVTSAKALGMLEAFYGESFDDRAIVVGDGDKLDLGGRALTFIAAPMVHWPEVITTFDEATGVWFSADAFGKFGALGANDEEGWACEARRYYFGIVGKYGAQVQSLLKKMKNYDVKAIYPLHGPTLQGDLSEYVQKYDTWSRYEPENEGVAVVYASVYGNTKKAAETLASELKALGAENVSLFDLETDDPAEAVEDAFRYDRLVLASTTYNGDVFPTMRAFLGSLTERNYQNRTVAFIENGSWAPTAAKVMAGALEKCKNIKFAETVVTVKSALSDESRAQIAALAKELAK